ncbi:MAG: hypothetical protein RLY87_2756 [Chloroflexota bacterium]|jgi:hypothetical protein
MKKFLILGSLLLLIACGSATQSSTDAMYASEPAVGAPMDAPVMAEAMPVERVMPPIEGGVAGSGSTAPLNPGERLVIRDASLTFQVADVAATDQQIRKAVNESKGYVLSSSTSGTDADVVIYMSLKIPSDQLDATITMVEKLADKVWSRSMSGSDVTEEYIDLSGRLTAQEAARDRLLELLKKAETVEAAVAVNSALTDVQSQIEQLSGRMRYLRQGSTFSSLNLEIHPIPTTPIVNPEGWQPLEDAKIALRGLLDFAQGIGTFLIGFVVWTPIWLPLFFLGRYLLRRWQRRTDVSPVA